MVPVRYERLLQQQSILAKFGALALRSDDIDELLTEACHLVGEALGTDLAKVMELQGDGDTLLVRAGVGWRPGVIGVATVTAASGSSEWHVLSTGEPTISPDIERESRFPYAPFLRENGVRSAINVIIRGHIAPPYGVLQVDSRIPRGFTEDDIQFLSNYANLLAGAVDRQKSRLALAQSYAALEARVVERTEELTRANALLKTEADDRAKLEDTLRQAMKMEAVGQLTGGIAHDFNNLLASISGSLELIEIRVDQGRTNELKRYLRAATSSVTRAAALTHRLLAFSRRQTLDPKPTDVNRVVEGLEDLFSRTVGPAISIETAIANDVWQTLCDRNQLENVLLNLVLNSRDAMPEGGRVVIGAENFVISMRQAARNWHGGDMPESGHGMALGDYVVLSVLDDGGGMPADVLTRAFDPFFTTKPLGQGTGLGLSMTYGFVKQSGGHVFLESEIGRGTKVTIYLPRHLAEAVGDSEAQHEKDDLSQAEQPVILVVEDESNLRMLLVEMLADMNYSVLEADAGRSGLTLLDTARRIDLLITDVGLPGGMNGRQLADAARQRRPDLKVLFVTGYAESAVMSGALMSDRMGVMTKPFAMATFQSRVEGMMADHPNGEMPSRR